MKKIRKAILAFLLPALLLFGPALTFANTDTASHGINLNVSEIAVLGLNDTGSISLATAGTVSAGADPSSAAAASDSTKYIKYTSVVNSGATRVITVALGPTDEVPAGTRLTVQAADAGTTNDGTPVGSEIPLTGAMSAANLITGIGSCATGTSATDGANITYNYSITDVTALEDDADATVTVTLTLSDY